MKFYIDYRFIVEAKDKVEAIKKIEKFLPDSSEDISYTISHFTCASEDLRK